MSQFRDEIAKFDAANVQVLGVSTDSVDSHKKFRAELELPFPLLADTQGQLSAMYDALIERGDQKISARKIVLIDKAGTIVFRNERLAVGDEAEWQAIVEAVQAL